MEFAGYIDDEKTIVDIRSVSLHSSPFGSGDARAAFAPKDGADIATIEVFLKDRIRKYEKDNDLQGKIETRILTH